ncbi:MAG: hypothetical protein GQ570_08210 [Helicobacteraceae bacterium]|nr:hypothetical protein [Helicobacteraceae bacterium]
MKDLMIFAVQNNRYAVSIENIQRIIQAPILTDIPNSHPLVEGMMSYEDNVIKVVGFREMINLPTYGSELKVLFDKLKIQHTEWVEALKMSVTKKVTFNKTTNPHICELGKWLDGFTSYDEHVSEILKELNTYHKTLHTSAVEILELLEVDQEAAIKKVETEVYEIYNHTMGAIDTFIAEFDIVAASLQKLLIYQGSEKGTFAIKVDSIVDIAHIDPSSIKERKESNKVSKFLELEGIIDLDNYLVNIIKSVELPENS